MNSGPWFISGSPIGPIRARFATVLRLSIILESYDVTNPVIVHETLSSKSPGRVSIPTALSTLLSSTTVIDT